jgi:hypothetical protein
VGTEQVYIATSASETIELEATVTDNVGLGGVSFARWDRVNQQWVEIATFSAPPYQARVDVSTLHMSWNEIVAGAVDTAGNQTVARLVISRAEAIHAIQFYLHTYYDPEYPCFRDSEGSDNLCPELDEQLSSIVLQPGWSVRLYKDPNQTEASKCFTASDEDLGNDQFDDGTPVSDQVSSFTLYQQPECGSPPEETPPVTPTPTSAPCPTPTITLSAPVVKVGDTIMVQGKNWHPGGTVAITIGGPAQLNVPPVSIPESGEWEISLGIGAEPLPGNYNLMFSENHEGCELSVTESFTISSDTQSPSLFWVKPVGNLAIYPKASGTVELEMTASDSSGIARVEMWRFGATGEAVLITEFTSPPYRASLNVSILDTGWNEIIATATDNAGNWGSTSIWVEHVATTPPSPQAPFYCITGPNSGCSAPPAPGQLPVPPPQPPLDPKESQVEAVQDLVVCVADFTGTNPWYVKYIPLFIEIVEGKLKWYGIIKYSSCIELGGETKPLTEFALEEREILKMYFEGTYRISVQVVCENKNQFGYLAQYLC